MTGGGQGMVECKSVGRRVEDVGVDGWKGDPCADRKGRASPSGREGEGEGLMTLITVETGGCRRRRRLRGFQKKKCASRPIGVSGHPKTRCSSARAPKSNAITPFRCTPC